MGFVRRDLGYIEALSREVGLEALAPRQYKNLLVISEVHRQQKWMYDNKAKRVDDGIVSISQPHVRPVKRSKACKDTEFGAKLSLSLVEGKFGEGKRRYGLQGHDQAGLHQRDRDHADLFGDESEKMAGRHFFAPVFWGGHGKRWAVWERHGRSWAFSSKIGRRGDGKIHTPPEPKSMPAPCLFRILTFSGSPNYVIESTRTSTYMSPRPTGDTRPLPLRRRRVLSRTPAGMDTLRTSRALV